MADDEDIAALVIDNGSGMCKGTIRRVAVCAFALESGAPWLRFGS